MSSRRFVDHILSEQDVDQTPSYQPSSLICTSSYFLSRYFAKFTGNETLLCLCQSSVCFLFVGTVEHISNAKLLLDYQISHLKVSTSATFSI